MDKAYRKKVIQQAEEAAIVGNTLLADGLKLLVKIYNDIDECHQAQKRMAAKGEYTSAIELKGMVDGYKKVAWDLQKVLNLR